MSTLDLAGIDSGLNCAKKYCIYPNARQFGFLIHHLKNESHPIIAQKIKHVLYRNFPEN